MAESFKTLKELGATKNVPNRRTRRKAAKKRGLFKTENRGQWAWLRVMGNKKNENTNQQSQVESN